VEFPYADMGAIMMARQFPMTYTVTVQTICSMSGVMLYLEVRGMLRYYYLDDRDCKFHPLASIPKSN
jgi:hypothetical protein